MKVDAVEPSTIRREKNGPVFDFVEPLVQKGTYYSIEGGGYFVVAPDAGLLPRFVVEVSLPQIAELAWESLRAIVWQMNDRSSGFIWFDSSDEAAYYLVWKCRLPVRASTPMFAWADRPGIPSAGGSGTVEISEVGGGAMRAFAARTLTSAPLFEGGLTPDAADELIGKGRVRVVTEDGAPVGVVSLFDHPTGNYVTVSGRLSDGNVGRGIEQRVVRALGTQLEAAGKRLVFAMPNTDAQSFSLARTLALPLVSKGWIGQLGSF